MNISDYILESNHQFLVGNKPGGISSIQDTSEDASFQEILSAYIKRDLHAITRIDRPVSGVVLYATKKEAAQFLTKEIQNHRISKKYLALVEGNVAQEEATLKHYLLKHKMKAQIVDEKNGKLAEMSFKTLGRLDNYTLLSIMPITGRFHQIRAQLSAIGYPIKGDVKYGARRKNKDRTIHLHSAEISFSHPVSKEKLEFSAALPVGDGLWNAAQEYL